MTVIFKYIDVNSSEETYKAKALKWIFTQVPAIILKNDFMDSEQIVYSKVEQKVYWENWSPRENITYSKREININETWEYVLNHAGDWIERAELCNR